MSTRCNIKLVTTDHEGHTRHDIAPVWLYHHHDGYPEGVGRELVRLLTNGGYHYNGPDCANTLLRCDEPMYAGETHGKNGFELTSGEHGDIEYLYEVFVGAYDEQERKPLPPTVRCFWKHYGGRDADAMPTYRYFTEIDLTTVRGDWEEPAPATKED